MPRSSRSNSRDNDELERTVFVNGLSYESTEEDVKDFFKECGDIERINLPRYQHSSKNVGYCHVRFSKDRYAKRALKLSGNYLDKRYLRIEMAQDIKSRRDRDDRPGRDRYDDRERHDRRDRDTDRGGFRDRDRDEGRGGYGRDSRRSEQQEDSSTVFIKNLPYDTNEDEVADFFHDCGSIRNVRLIFDPRTSKFKGFGYVDFKSPDSAKNGLKLNGKTFGGRSIFVDLDFKGPRAGFNRDYKTAKEFRRDASRSRSGSRGRRNNRSRSRSRDRVYKHTTANRSGSNDRKFGNADDSGPANYYRKDEGKGSRSSSKSSSSKSSGSSKSSRSSSRNSNGSGKVNLDLKDQGDD